MRQAGREAATTDVTDAPTHRTTLWSRGLRGRARYLALTAATIVLGLVTHRRGGALSLVVRDVLSDALWAAMVAFGIAAVAPAIRRPWRAAGALTFCFVVEFSQLVHSPALDALRRTTAGHLVLGSGFDPRDFAAYAAGVVAAVLVERAIERQRSDRPVRVRPWTLCMAVAMALICSASLALGHQLSGSSGPDTQVISPTVEVSVITERHNDGVDQLELLVLWRGAGGWFLRPGSMTSGRGTSAEHSHLTIRRGNLQLTLEYDRPTRVVTIQGKPFNLPGDNVVFVDAVDVPEGPRVTGTMRVAQAMPGPPGKSDSYCGSRVRSCRFFAVMKRFPTCPSEPGYRTLPAEPGDRKIAVRPSRLRASPVPDRAKLFALIPGCPRSPLRERPEGQALVFADDETQRADFSGTRSHRRRHPAAREPPRCNVPGSRVRTRHRVNPRREHACAVGCERVRVYRGPASANREGVLSPATRLGVAPFGTRGSGPSLSWG